MIILRKGSLLVFYAFIVKKMRYFSHTLEARAVLLIPVTMDFGRLEHLILAQLGGSWFQFYSYVHQSIFYVDLSWINFSQRASHCNGLYG